MTIIPFPATGDSCRCGDNPQTMLTLPVAPMALSRIRFDQIDAPARAVPPSGALNWLKENLEQGAKITAVNINGPGDPLHDIECTRETLQLIRKNYPDMAFSITTLGLHAEQYAASLAEEGVTGVTLLVDAVDQKVAEKIYAWIRPGRKTIPLAQAAGILMTEQLLAVKAFKGAGCTVTVKSTVYPGVNDEHIEEIAKVLAESGADAMTLIPCRTFAGQEGPVLSPPDEATMQALQKKAAHYLETCIAINKEPRIGADCSSSLGACKSIATLQPKPTKARPNIAVVSLSGMEVDLHLGQAYQVLIYGPREDGLTCLLGTRPVPDPGSGSSRWEELAKTLHDCFAILASSAGESPRHILGQHGITVLITDNEIEGTVDLLYGGGKKGRCKK